jgi:large subunit ribosomal protein L18
MTALKPKELHARRTQRVRTKIRQLAEKKTASARPRLSVFRSSEHIYAQIIDDRQGITLAAASSLKLDGKTGANIDAAKKVGLAVAEAAKAKGITAVVFDRGGYLFHGRVKALAEGAREGGLQF